jgi:hypothetical protein
MAGGRRLGHIVLHRCLVSGSPSDAADMERGGAATVLFPSTSALIWPEARNTFRPVVFHSGMRAACTRDLQGRCDCCLLCAVKPNQTCAGVSVAWV